MLIKKTYMLVAILLLISGILVGGFVSVTGQVSESLESTVHTTTMLANRLDDQDSTVKVPGHYDRKYFENLVRRWYRRPDFDEQSFDVSVIK